MLMNLSSFLMSAFKLLKGLYHVKNKGVHILKHQKRKDTVDIKKTWN